MLWICRSSTAGKAVLYISNTGIGRMRIEAPIQSVFSTFSRIGFCLEDEEQFLLRDVNTCRDNILSNWPCLIGSKVGQGSWWTGRGSLEHCYCCPSNLRPQLIEGKCTNLQRRLIRKQVIRKGAACEPDAWNQLLDRRTPSCFSGWLNQLIRFKIDSDYRCACLWSLIRPNLTLEGAGKYLTA